METTCGGSSMSENKNAKTPADGPKYERGFAAERDQARELLERCETEMRYAGWTKYESDNPARHEVYEEVKEFLARGNT